MFAFLGCTQKTKKQVNSTHSNLISEKDNLIKTESNDLNIEKAVIIFSNGFSYEKMELSKPTIIIIQMDSLEIEQIKKNNGESNFYTSTDDLMWYNAMMLKKMDSLKIDVKYSDKDTIQIESQKLKYKIIKNTDFSFYTYFYFDGIKIERKDLFELIGN